MNSVNFPPLTLQNDSYSIFQQTKRYVFFAGSDFLTTFVLEFITKR